MIFDHKVSPKGTVRDWINFRADTAPNVKSHYFFKDDSELSWAELCDAAKSIAAYLTDLGITKGESVATCMPNSREGIICLFGILYGGFRATPLNLAAGPAALGHAISHSKTNHIFISPCQKSVCNAALQETTVKPNLITVTEETCFDTLDIKLHDVSETDHALLMYTSGTTGLPKGVVHSQSSLLAGGWTTAVAHELTEQDRAFCVLPFYHINGLCVTLVAPLISGGFVAVAQRFSNTDFWHHCESQKITWFSVVPTIISHLLHSDREPNAACKANMRFARSASAPLAPEIQRGFEDKFGIPIVETMGLTETSAQILSNPLPPGLRKIGSPGIGYGNEIAILDENMKRTDACVTGELAVRGPNVLLEYLDNKDATDGTFTSDGWMRTGDLGYQDQDGYVFITGRLKELIIKGGENIAPREIDEALYCHNDVVEAAAFARPCQKYGQRVEAAVRLTKGSQTTDKELLSLCERKLGSFKSPDCIYILPELPKGPSGKIQRLKLADTL